jgi:hypothetical protein
MAMSMTEKTFSKRFRPLVIEAALAGPYQDDVELVNRALDMMSKSNDRSTVYWALRNARDVRAMLLNEIEAIRREDGNRVG